MGGRGLAMLLLAAALLGGCSVLSGSIPGQVPPPDTALPYPDGCDAFQLSPHRCDAIVQEMAKELGVDPTSATSVDLLGDPGCGQPAVNDQGQRILCIRTTSFVVRVRFHLPDGQAPEQSVFCSVGGEYTILCTENPEVRVSSPILGGYHDIPCAGEAPAGCATPVPTVDLAVASKARPLEIASLDVPLDHLGTYSIELGEATLANGILQDARFTLADLHPTSYATTEVGVRMVVTSADTGEPLQNVYEHGWRAGLERVRVRLDFEISAADPGAVLPVRDVSVH